MSLSLNNIYLGDCNELIKQIPDKTIDLIITDPPYDFGQGEMHNAGFVKNRKIWKQISGIANGFDKTILDEWVRVLKNIYVYVWCNKEQIYDYITYFVKEHNCNFEIFVWCKTNPTPLCSNHYLKDKEYCLLFWEKGKCELNSKYERMHTFYVQKVNKADKRKYHHPTVKPLDITKNFVENSTVEGGVILDTFCGSGTTCVASKELNRNYIGFEINPDYYKIALDRINGIERDGQMTLFD